MVEGPSLYRKTFLTESAGTRSALATLVQVASSAYRASVGTGSSRIPPPAATPSTLELLAKQMLLDRFTHDWLAEIYPQVANTVEDIWSTIGTWAGRSLPRFTEAANDI